MVKFMIQVHQKRKILHRMINQNKIEIEQMPVYHHRRKEKFIVDIFRKVDVIGDRIANIFIQILIQQKVYNKNLYEISLSYFKFRFNWSNY